MSELPHIETPVEVLRRVRSHLPGTVARDIALGEARFDALTNLEYLQSVPDSPEKQTAAAFAIRTLQLLNTEQFGLR